MANEFSLMMATFDVFDRVFAAKPQKHTHTCIACGGWAAHCTHISYDEALECEGEHTPLCHRCLLEERE